MNTDIIVDGFHYPFVSHPLCISITHIKKAPFPQFKINANALMHIKGLNTMH